MLASIILGWTLVGLGILIIIIGVTMGVLITLSEILSKTLDKISKITLNFAFPLELIKSISELLKEMLKAPGGIFFVVGLILTGSGILLLVYTPF